jgi:ribosomal protein S18 acetylase RimI-like enzyme
MLKSRHDVAGQPDRDPLRASLHLGCAPRRLRGHPLQALLGRRSNVGLRFIAMSVGLGRDVLVFKPIDFDAHGDLCIAFRRDTFISSFGWDGFFAKDGDKGESYLNRLRAHSSRFPDGNVHVWDDGAIVGQLEMRVLDDPRCGHVSLFYLVEQARGSGAGDYLQRYAMRFMRSQGVGAAQLNVSPTNARALNYYRKHGWKDCGLRPGRDDVHLMELIVTAATPL